MGLFFSSDRFTRPGPGVRPDAPRKKGVARLAEIMGRDMWNFFRAGFLAFLGCLQVVEFPPVNVIIEMNQFIAFRTYTIMTFHHVFSGIFVEMIVESLPPIFRMFAFQQGDEGYTLYV